MTVRITGYMIVTGICYIAREEKVPVMAFCMKYFREKPLNQKQFDWKETKFFLEVKTIRPCFRLH